MGFPRQIRRNVLGTDKDAHLYRVTPTLIHCLISDPSLLGRILLTYCRQRNNLGKILKSHFVFLHPSRRLHGRLVKLSVLLLYSLPEIVKETILITTKFVCFSRLLKCLRSLYGKQCGPRSDCSHRSSLFWVHAVCFFT